jgi:hypothetical protein
MNIYVSTKTLPYVYILTHKETGQFYIGARWANKVPSSIDLGVNYFTSSKYVKPIFDQFECEIVAEFFFKEEAYKFEQQMIYENWSNPLKLNKKYHLHNELKWMAGPMSEETKRKISIANSNPSEDRRRKMACPIEKREGRNKKISAANSNPSAETRKKMSIAKKGVKTGPCLAKGKSGQNNNLSSTNWPQNSIKEKERRIKQNETRAKRSKDQNLQSYSRQKSPEELQKLKYAAKTRSRVCRIKDHKEMDVANFLKYLKTKPHLY